MIPELYRQRYQVFRAQVVQVQAQVPVRVASTQDGSVRDGSVRDGSVLKSATLKSATLKSAIAQLQQHFHSEILGLEDPQRLPPHDLGGALDPGIAQRLRSLQVEIDKQLKLLAMDVLFLQTARQATTLDQRLQQMGDRLERVDRYCAIVLEAPASTESPELNPPN